jgi:hypothetical protein
MTAAALAIVVPAPRVVRRAVWVAFLSVNIITKLNVVHDRWAAFSFLGLWSCFQYGLLRWLAMTS